MPSSAQTQGEIIVIGAGIGGLTTAARLACAGYPVRVLEAHIYPGGCAGTFYHQQYRFDAGATLAGGFYPGGPMDLVANAVGIPAWPLHPATPAMVVHLPTGQAVTRWGNGQRWAEYACAFGQAAIPFWQWQEKTADALWDLALRSPPWPPQSAGEAGRLLHAGLHWLGAHPRHHLAPTLFADAWRPLAAHLQGMPAALRLFVDAQLLIAAQATSAEANALYGASALDLPRRGVVHLTGGIGAIATTLVDAIRRHGGEVCYRQEVQEIVMTQGRPVAVVTKRGERFAASAIVANLPPWNIAKLLGENAPPRLRHLPSQPQDGWGAFVLYVGLEGSSLPPDFPLHHQVIVREPLAEGNTIFISISPAWDTTRAPAGQRAVTISTHTDFAPWWRLFEQDRAHYEAQKAHYTRQMMEAATRALPRLHEDKRLVLPGTPVTFRRFTRRAWGWVGGFPQTSLWRAWGPKLLPKLWMVGDSIFPGQSTAAVALGGLRVAQTVMAEFKR
ncbi:MAG: NAD(P)/FAD-dependent oxidoreductase [Caldilineaceae bacterium]